MSDTTEEDTEASAGEAGTATATAAAALEIVAIQPTAVVQVWESGYLMFSKQIHV